MVESLIDTSLRVDNTSGDPITASSLLNSTFSVSVLSKEFELELFLLLVGFVHEFKINVINTNTTVTLVTLTI